MSLKTPKTAPYFLRMEIGWFAHGETIKQVIQYPFHPISLPVVSCNLLPCSIPERGQGGNHHWSVEILACPRTNSPTGRSLSTMSTLALPSLGGERFPMLYPLTKTSTFWPQAFLPNSKCNTLREDRRYPCSKWNKKTPENLTLSRYSGVYRNPMK